MPLDDLVSMIETLQQRIGTHRQSLQQNEIRTRTALIDPLLTALGWDVSDPGLVTPEHSVDGGWADYALRGQGNQPAAIIEAKRLGTLVENHLGQMVNYCIQEGIAYSGVTDGNHWQLYRTFEPVPMADKIVLDVNISNTSAYECALKLLMLWRPNLSSGKATPAGEPLLVEWADEEIVEVTEDMVEKSLPSTPYPSPAPSNSPPSATGWIKLSDWNPPPKTSARATMRFPDGREETVRKWTNLLTVAGEWLNDSGKLAPVPKPILSGPTEKVLDTDRSGFIASAPISGTGFWLNTHGNAGNLRRKTRVLLERCGVSPDAVWLRVEP